MKYQVSVPFSGFIRYVIDVPDDAQDPKAVASSTSNELFEKDELTFTSSIGEVDYEIQGENGDEPVGIDLLDDDGNPVVDEDQEDSD